MSAIDQSSLMTDILNVFKLDKSTPSSYRYDVDIYANDKIITPLSINKVTVLDDYVNRYAPVIMVEASIGLGDYHYDIFKYRHNLRAAIKMIQTSPTNEHDLDDMPVRYQNMIMVLADNEDHIATLSGMAGSTREELNHSNLYTFHFQLIDESIYKTRQFTISGIVDNTTIEGLLYNTLMKSPDVKGCNIVPPTSNKVIENLVIPTKLIVDFPAWLQSGDSGVGIYNAGCGWYMQSGYWFVYPTHDTTRYDSSDDKLTVCNIPPSRMPNPERTYTRYNDGVYILATAMTKFTDHTDKLQLTAGNAAKFVKADIMDSNGIITEDDGNVYFDKRHTTSNIMSEVRADGVNSFHYGSDTPTVNQAAQISRVASNRGVVVSFQWLNPNPTLITPGMPCRYIYLDGTKVKSLYGVVLKKEAVSSKQTGGIINKKLTTTCVVDLYLDREVK